MFAIPPRIEPTSSDGEGSYCWTMGWSQAPCAEGLTFCMEKPVPKSRQNPPHKRQVAYPSVYRVSPAGEGVCPSVPKPAVIANRRSAAKSCRGLNFLFSDTSPRKPPASRIKMARGASGASAQVSGQKKTKTWSSKPDSSNLC